MDSRELFAKAVQVATSCIRHVREEELKNPTPCSEWNLQALLNHMVYELLWAPELLRGKTVAEIGDRFDGDVLRSDFRSSWQHAADSALIAVKSAEPGATVHLSYGEVTAEHYMKELGCDIAIHSWDVAQSINCTLYMDDSLAKEIYDFMAGRKEELVSSGLFDAPIEIQEDATIQEKLLALTGRSADKWLADTRK